MTTKTKKIRALYGFTKLPDGEVGHLLATSLEGLTNNVDLFPNPSVAT